jgi:glucose/mannose transport system permease protein
LPASSHRPTDQDGGALQTSSSAAAAFRAPTLRLVCILAAPGSASQSPTQSASQAARRRETMTVFSTKPPGTSPSAVTSSTSTARPKTRARRPNRLFRNLSAKIASIPMVLTAVVIFLGGTVWTVVYSFTNSKLLPRLTFVGLDQYERLWSTPRWLVSIQNLATYGILSLIFSLVIGFLLAALMDQKIRFEDTFRTIFLYPFALSFIVTGLVWQWILNPEFGVQSVVRSLGWSNFTFDPLYNEDIVIYGILIAALWQGTGLVMCLLLAGLRGIDEDIWKAARVDGIPMWRTYLFIIIPMMRPVFVTTLVIIASGIVRIYDLVVAQTSGGPGIASDVPAKYVYDYMFFAQNLGQGFAASSMMLLAVAIVIVPWAYLEFGGRKRG